MENKNQKERKPLCGRFLALVFSLALTIACVAALCFTAFAEDEIVVGEGLTVVTAQDVAHLVDDPSVTKIVIAEGVVKIDAAAFVGFGELREVVLPSTIEQINPYAFDGCTKLARVNFPASLELISFFAFRNTGLSEVDLSATKLTNLLESFEYCENLRKIVFPPNLAVSTRTTVVFADAFEGCVIEEIGFAEGKESNTFFVKDGCLIDSDGTLWMATQNAVIPTDGSVVKIAPYAFNCVGEGKSIAIPASVSVIDPLAFFHEYGGTFEPEVSDGIALETVIMNAPILPDGYEKLKTLMFHKDYYSTFSFVYEGDTFAVCEEPQGDSPYYIMSQHTHTFGEYISYDGFSDRKYCADCGAYREQYAEGVIYLAPADNVVDAADVEMYKEDASATHFVIAEGVSSIGSSAFQDFVYLEEVILPNTVSSISSYAFQNCTSLYALNFPSALTGIYTKAFSGSGLTSVDLSATQITSVYGIFENCTSLRSIVLPSTLAIPASGSIGGGFTGCTLSEISFKKGYESSLFRVKGGCLIDKNGALQMATVNSKIPTDGSVVTFLSYAFTPAGSPLVAELPHSLTSMASQAFSVVEDGVSRMTAKTVVLNSEYSPTEIYNYHTLMIHEDHYSYYSTETSVLTKFAAKYVEEPTGVSPYYILSKHVHEWGEVTAYDEYTNRESCTACGAYHILPKDGTMVVGLGGTSVLSKHLAAIAKDETIQRIVVLEGVTIIGAAFADCDFVQELILPDTVTSIVKGAFSGMESLERLTIPFVGSGNGAEDTGSQYFDDINTLVWVFNGSSKVLKELTVTQDTALDAETFDSFTALERVTFLGKIDSIPYNAFYNCTSLKSFVIPDHIVKIGQDAFRYCTSLSYVYIPAGLTTIGSDAFAYTSSKVEFDIAKGNETFAYIDECLVDLTKAALIRGSSSGIIPDEVTKIFSGAFSRISGLGELVIPERVTLISGEAFRLCDGLTKVTILGPVEQIWDNCFAYSEDLETVILPNTLKSIQMWAFAYCKGLKTIAIPEGTTALIDRCFMHCESLTEVTLPSTLTEIGYAVFAHCYSLDDITLPTSLTTIGKKAFESCSSLSGIQLPEGIGTIAAGTFANCTSLTALHIPASLTGISLGNSVDLPTFLSCPLETVTIAEGNETFRLENNCLAAGNFVYLGFDGATVPDGTETIGYCAFMGRNLGDSFYVPDSVTSIGQGAFDGATVTSISFPTVSLITSKLFHYNSSLTSVPASLEEIVIRSAESIPNIAFSGWSGVERFVLPEGLLTIGAKAFYQCTGLLEINIPSTLTSIVSEAFYGCKSLERVYAHSAEHWLSMKIGSNPLDYAKELYFGDTLVTDFVIPDGTVIPEGILGNYPALISLTIPYLGASIDATTGCNLLYVFKNVPASLQKVTVTGGTTVSYNAFACGSITEVHLPATITTIGEEQYYGKTGLESLEILTIPECDYFGWSSGIMYGKASGKLYWRSSDIAGDIVIPKEVTAIPPSYFKDQAGITSVSFTEGALTSVGESAFAGCGSIREIVLPEGLKYVGAYAFQGCGALVRAVIPTTVTYMGASTFAGCNMLASLTLPYVGEYNDYSSGSSNRYLLSWNLGTGLYRSHEALKELIITAARDIASEAFIVAYVATASSDLLCPNLERLVLPSTLKVIQPSLLRRYNHLKEVVLPEGIVEIGAYAFFDCYRLSEVTLPSTVTKIGNYAFSNTAMKGTLVIGPNVTSIGDYAFSDTDLDYVRVDAVALTSGASAFSNISRRSTLVIGSGVTMIPSHLLLGRFETLIFEEGIGAVTIKGDSPVSSGAIDSIYLPTSFDASYFTYFTHSKPKALYITNPEFLDGFSTVNGYPQARFLEINLIAVVKGNHTLPAQITSRYYQEEVTEGGYDWMFYYLKEHSWYTYDGILEDCALGGDIVERCENCARKRDTHIDPRDHVIEQLDELLATCTEAGHNAHEYCTMCLYTTRVDYEVLGHALVNVEMLLPDCVNEGYNSHEYCTRCTHTTKVVLAALGHKNEEVTVDSTCTEEGRVDGICTVCGNVTPLSIIEMKPHEETFVTTDSTCTHEGSTVYTCTVCSNIRTVTIERKPHDNSEVVTDSTCTALGHVDDVCTVCGHTTLLLVIDKKPHSYAEITTDSTCAVLGHVDDVCSVCGDTQLLSVIDKKPHTFGAWVVTVAPTELTRGERYHDCAICTHRESEVMSVIAPTAQFERIVTQMLSYQSLPIAERYDILYRGIIIWRDVPEKDRAGLNEEYSYLCAELANYNLRVQQTNEAHERAFTLLLPPVKEQEPVACTDGAWLTVGRKEY